MDLITQILNNLLKSTINFFLIVAAFRNSKASGKLRNLILYILDWG